MVEDEGRVIPHGKKGLALEYTEKELDRMKTGRKEKKCSKCKGFVLKTSFSKNSKAKDGLQSQCKKCSAETSRQRYIKKQLNKGNKTPKRNWSLHSRIKRLEANSTELNDLHTRIKSLETAMRKLKKAVGGV